MRLRDRVLVDLGGGCCLLTAVTAKLNGNLDGGRPAFLRGLIKWSLSGHRPGYLVSVIT